MNDRDQALVERIQGLGLGCFGEDEVGFMLATVRAHPPDAVLDWGTNRGSSARLFFEFGCPEIHTVDLPEELAAVDRDHAGRDTGLHIRGVNTIRRYRGDGVTVALTIARARGFQWPLFFIDGDHSYENVVRELRWLRRAAPVNATYLLHDTRGWPGKAAWHIMGPTYDIVELGSQAGMMRLTRK